MLQQFRRASAIVIESVEQAQRATEAFDRGKGDFADYLIAEHASAHGCTEVLTFDRALSADSRFRRL